MFIDEKYRIKTIHNKNSNKTTYVLLEKMTDGRWKQIDSVDSEHAESAYIRFYKKIGQLT